MYFVYAYLSHTVSAQLGRTPSWVMRGSQLVQTIFLGTVSTVALLALNLLLGYFLISPPGIALLIVPPALCPPSDASPY